MAVARLHDRVVLFPTVSIAFTVMDMNATVPWCTILYGRSPRPHFVAMGFSRVCTARRHAVTFSVWTLFFLGMVHTIMGACCAVVPPCDRTHLCVLCSITWWVFNVCTAARRCVGLHCVGFLMTLIRDSPVVILSCSEWMIPSGRQH